MAAMGSGGSTKRTSGTRASLGDCLAAFARRYGTAREGVAAGRGGWAATRRERAALFRESRAAGLRVRRRILTWDGLPRRAAQLPAIVSFRDGSCLILTETRMVDGMAMAVLEHPAFSGRPPLVVDRLRFEKVWTGELILVRPGARGSSATPFGWGLVRALVRQEKGLVRDGLAASLALAVLAAAPILFVQLLLLRVLPAKADRSLLILAVGVGVALVMESVLRAVRGAIASRLAARVEARLAALLFDRLLGLPVASVEAQAAGDMRRRVDDLSRVGTALSEIAPRLVLEGAVLLVTVPLMAFLDARLAVAALAVLALVAAASVAARPRLHAAATRLSEAQARRTAFLDQTLDRIQTVKGLALGPDRMKQWDRQTAALGHARLTEARLADRLDVLALLAERGAVLGTLLLGLALPALVGGTVALAPLVAVMLFVQRLTAPLSTVVAMLEAEAAATVAVERLTAVLKQPADAAGGMSDTAGAQGTVAFEDVEFTYPGALVPALQGVSFTVEAGTTLGIMGASGAGRSAIVRLMQRLHVADHGTIRIAGADIRDLDPDGLRRIVAAVPQTSALLAGTIRDTLTAAKPGATFEEMARAARLAAADDFIAHLPRGYETVLHEGAPTLSAGQRQRLALARTLITDPTILILDDALNAVDPDLVGVIDANLRDARRGLTTIVISHRLASLTTADSILVLQEGRVVDQGSHAALLERCDTYATAWARQQGAPDGEGAEPLLALS